MCENALFNKLVEKIPILHQEICPNSLGRISGWVHQLPAMFLRAGMTL